MKTTYKEGFTIPAGLLIVGLLLQLTIGRVNLSSLAFPINLITLFIFLAGLIIIHLCSKKVYFFRQLSTLQFVIPSIASVVILVIFMGLTPQYQSDVELSGLIGRLGLMQMLSAWYFVLIFLWFLIILGMVIIRRISNFGIKKDIPFILNHLGLLIALLCGVLGSADLQKLKLIASNEKPEWRAFDNQNNIVELPLAIELNHFTIDEYPPKLMLVNHKTGKVIPEQKPVNMLIDDNFTSGELSDWQITILNRLENAALIITKDTVKYVEYHSFGSTCAALVKAINQKTQQHQEGWVSCGNFMFPPKSLQLDENTSLIMPDREPRRYASDVTVYTQSEKIINATIEVNKPLKVEGWKIYQSSFDENKGKWSEISIFELVRDPWLPVVYTGIFMMIAGAVLMFILPQKK